MDKLPKLTPENQKILETLAELVNFTKDELTKNPIYKDKLTLKQLLVINMFTAVNSYTEAIFELCKQSRPDAASVILRSITEAWINSVYILSFPNNKFLYLFAIEDSYYKKALVQLFKEFYKKYPNQRSVLLTESELKKMAKKAEDELKVYETKLGISFKNKEEFDKKWSSLLHRAIETDKRLKKRQKDKAGGMELTHLMVYKYLSEYTHLSIGGLKHFWIEDQSGEEFLILDKNPSGMELVLATTYAFYLYFAGRLKHYGIVTCSFAKYNTFFIKNIAGRNKAPVPQEPLEV